MTANPIPASAMAPVGDIVAQIPAIAVLHSASLRRSVAATWEESLRRSPYTLEQTPQSPLMMQRSLLRHVNEVNQMAIHLIGVAADTFGLDVDHDVALATAILHDVDKPLIFRRVGSELGFAPGTTLKDHGGLGADLAAEMGVPARISDMIRVHSPFASSGLPGTPEGTIVHYADFVANDFACEASGAPPIHSSLQYTHQV
jgi:putative nucleotidyltransferase with HDIG domain